MLAIQNICWTMAVIPLLRKLDLSGILFSDVPLSGLFPRQPPGPVFGLITTPTNRIERRPDESSESMAIAPCAASCIVAGFARETRTFP